MSNVARLRPEPVTDPAVAARAADRQAARFRKRVVATLTTTENALNIAFGAILSAYIGNVLTVVDNGPFNQWALAGFFLLVGLFIGGLCLGNTIMLEGRFRLGALLMAGGSVAAFFSLRLAAALAFEVPILRILYVCWISMLLGSNAVMTLVLYLHHKSAK